MNEKNLEQGKLPGIVIDEEKKANTYAQGCVTILYLLMLLILVGTILGFWIKYFWIGMVFA